MSRIRPIGDDEDDGDESCDAGPQQVGSGCAELTPVEPDPSKQLDHAARIALKLRKAGATFVKVGEFEVAWQVEQKPAAADS